MTRRETNPPIHAWPPPVPWTETERDIGETHDDGAPLGDEVGPEWTRSAPADPRSRALLVVGGLFAAVGLVLVLGGVLSRDSPDVDDLLAQGVAQQNAGQLEAATEIYRRVIDADPDNAIAFFNLGVINQTQSQNQEAAANYLRTLSIDPRYGPALFNLAVLRGDEGDTQGAIGLYRRLVAIDSDHAGALLNLGILLLSTGEVDEASELISRAVELDPSLQQTDVTPPPSSPTTTAAGGAQQP